MPPKPTDKNDLKDIEISSDEEDKSKDVADQVFNKPASIPSFGTQNQEGMTLVKSSIPMDVMGSIVKPIPMR